MESARPLALLAQSNTFGQRHTAWALRALRAPHAPSVHNPLGICRGWVIQVGTPRRRGRATARTAPRGAATLSEPSAAHLATDMQQAARWTRLSQAEPGGAGRSQAGPQVVPRQVAASRGSIHGVDHIRERAPRDAALAGRYFIEPGGVPACRRRFPIPSRLFMVLNIFKYPLRCCGQYFIPLSPQYSDNTT